MTEQVTDTQVAQENITETQPETLVEENNIQETATENATDNNNDSTGEELVQQEQEVQEVTTTPEQTIEELTSKLKEYELRDQDINKLKERLNLNYDTPEATQLTTIDATIDNQAQQRFISICNKFGVDYRPEAIDASAKELESKNPQEYWRLRNELDTLDREVSSQKQYVQHQKVNYEVSNFVNKNGDFINNSPVTQQLLNGYIQGNINNMVNPQAELGNFLHAVQSVYAEAIEVGKQLATMDIAKKDKSGISGGIATANTSTSALQSQRKIFTRQDINNMSDEEFRKNEKEIDRQYIEGLIK